MCRINFLSDFPLRPKKPSGLRNVAINIYTYVKGSLGLGGNKVVQAKDVL